MFNICIDDNGYYAEEYTENRVEVQEMPNVEDVKHLKAYRYDPEKEELVLDENELETIKEEIAREKPIPSTEERLATIEQAFLELVDMVMTGGDK